MTFQRTNSVLQTLAAIATVIAAWAAAAQFINSERRTGSRQQGLVFSAASSCERVGSLMVAISREQDMVAVEKGLAGMIDANGQNLIEIPVTEMPSGLAVDSLMECRIGARLYADNVRIAPLDGASMCANGRRMMVFADFLRREARKPGGPRPEVPDVRVYSQGCPPAVGEQIEIYEVPR